MELENLVESVIKRVMEKINEINKKRFLILSNSNQDISDITECISSKFIADVSEDYEKIQNYDYVVIESKELLKILKDRQKKFNEEVKASNETNDIFKIDKKIITEKDLLPFVRLNAKCIYILEKAILTPLALDIIKENKIELVRKR